MAMSHTVGYAEANEVSLSEIKCSPAGNPIERWRAEGVRAQLKWPGP